MQIGGEKMRFKLYFTLENLQIPIQYRKSIIMVSIPKPDPFTRISQYKVEYT